MLGTVNISNIHFISNNHTRFNKGIKSDNNNLGALRGILVRQIDNEYFEVSIHLLDDSLSNWGEQLQMAPKIMYIEEIGYFDHSITLKGIASDSIFTDFSDYGIRIQYDLTSTNITMISLFLYDRDITIEYDAMDLYLFKQGFNYCYGENGFPKDRTKAFKFFLQAAKMGMYQAQRLVGICYNTGDGVEKNPSEAQKWFDKSIAQLVAAGQIKDE